MKILHYVAEDINILVLEFRDDIEPDYGTQVAPGITMHYAGSRGEGEIVPILLEIEQTRSRPLNHVDFERLNEHGERLDEPDAAEVLRLWLALPAEARRSIGEKMREEGKAAATK